MELRGIEGDSISFRIAVSSGKYGACDPKSARSIGTRGDFVSGRAPIIRPTMPLLSQREMSIAALVSRMSCPRSLPCALPEKCSTCTLAAGTDFIAAINGAATTVPGEMAG